MLVRGRTSLSREDVEETPKTLLTKANKKAWCMIRSEMISELAFPIDEKLEEYMVALRDGDQETLDEMNAQMAEAKNSFYESLNKIKEIEDGVVYIFANRASLIESLELTDGELTLQDYLRAILSRNGGYIGRSINGANRAMTQYSSGGLRHLAIKDLPEERDTQFCETMLHRLLNIENIKLYRESANGKKFHGPSPILMKEWDLDTHKFFALYLLIQGYEAAKVMIRQGKL